MINCIKNLFCSKTYTAKDLEIVNNEIQNMKREINEFERKHGFVTGVGAESLYNKINTLYTKRNKILSGLPTE